VVPQPGRYTKRARGPDHHVAADSRRAHDFRSMGGVKASPTTGNHPGRR
jgi:hypothetical protein